MAPTRRWRPDRRELRTYGQFLRFRHAAVYGGVHQGPQVKALSRGVDALVATPGRLLDLMEQGHIDLKDVEFFVLDEADRMLDMGFAKDVRKIVSALPKRRHSLFFAATMSKEVGELAGRLLTDPVRSRWPPRRRRGEDRAEDILRRPEGKNPLLIGLLQQKFLKRVLVFTRTKRRADRVAKVLTKTGIRADAIHGDRTQNQRTSALGGFKAGRLQVLVATDIAARGIDVEDISHVINYDLPNEAESYVHRIGRTGRAGRAGTAYSFCSAEERSFLRDIERLTRTKIREVDHRYHSEEAKNASGAASEPAPRRTKRPPRRAGEKGVPPGRSRRPGPRR